MIEDNLPILKLVSNLNSPLPFNATYRTWASFGDGGAIILQTTLQTRSLLFSGTDM